MAFTPRTSPAPHQFEKDIWQIDLLEQNLPYRTGAYVILDDAPTLIETGAGSAHDVLIAGLKTLGLKPTDLAYVIVTHVHLDHAGGAGQMMRQAPQAKLVVHPRGQRHMIDPSKLWAGAQAVYGDQTTVKFGSVEPVDASQVIVQEHASTLDIGKRRLSFFDAPGHAKHHFTILSETDKALFAGDAVGILYPTEFTGYPFSFIMPSSSPIDFDPDAVHQTMAMLRDIPFDWVYHTHFGRSPKADAIFHTERMADAFASMIKRVYRPDIGKASVITSLQNLILEDLSLQGQTIDNIGVLDIDVVLDAMGLIYYEEKRRSKLMPD